MAETSSFFNSINSDRLYDADSISTFLGSFLSNGILSSPSTNLQVIASTGMAVTVQAGKSFILGRMYNNDSNLTLTHSIADGVLNRIDLIVCQLSIANREIKTVIKKGVASSSPVAPVVQRDNDIFELTLAKIYIGKGVTSITQANITDLRLTSNCGIADSLMTVDTQTIFDQYQAWFTSQSSIYNASMIASEATFATQFNSWFSTVQNTLSGDVAGNLNNLITANTNAISTKAPINNPTFTGAVTLPFSTTIAGVSPTKIGYLSNIASDVQTQLNSSVKYTDMPHVSNYYSIALDGTITQWGTAQCTGGGVQVNFIKHFTTTTAPVPVLVCSIQTSPSPTCTIWHGSVTATGCYINSSHTNTFLISWIAVGR